MTPLTKSVTRVVLTSDGDTLVVTCAREGLYIREKGRRTEYGPLTYGHLLLDGARLKAQQAAAERKRHRAARRVAR